MPADLSFLRSPKVIIGGVLLAVMATACACSNLDDDDDCNSMENTVSTAAIPASGGFGTHLASCGG